MWSWKLAQEERASDNVRDFVFPKKVLLIATAFVLQKPEELKHCTCACFVNISHIDTSTRIFFFFAAIKFLVIMMQSASFYKPEAIFIGKTKIEAKKKKKRFYFSFTCTYLKRKIEICGWGRTLKCGERERERDKGIR